MKAEIISIGDELLIGQVVNTNAVYLSQELTLLGIDVCWVTTIGDDYAAIFEALEAAKKRSDVILMTGGLGPTHDDVTKKIVCDFFKADLVENQEVLANVSRIFTNLGRSLDDRNAEQAMVPENATVLSNRIGTAPGLFFNTNDFQLFVLPGVPMEMKAIFSDHIQGILKKYNVADSIENVTLKTTGIFESKLFDKVQDIVTDVEAYAAVAFLPSFTGVNLRITVKGADAVMCQKQLNAACQQFEERLGSYVYAKENMSMPEIVQDLLTEKQATLAVVDAFTGGKILEWLTPNSTEKSGYCGGVGLNKNSASIPTFLHIANSVQGKMTSSERVESLARAVRTAFSTSYGLALFAENSRDGKNYKVHYALVDACKTCFDEYEIRKERTDNSKRAAQFGLNFLRMHLLSR